MKQPLVSVCIPVFNAERTIERCITGVIAQQINEMEILLIDNASEDKTISLAKDMLQDKPNAKIVHNKTNLGRVENWNRCLQFAKGKYVKFALANDVLFKNSVQILIEEAQQDPEIVMVCSKPRFVDKIPSDTPEMQPGSSKVCLSNLDTIKFFGESGCRTGGLNSMLLLREPMINNNIFFRENLPYCADYFHAIELAAKGKTVFLDAESYCFDGGMKSRFHYAGLENARKFFLEQRECALQIAKYLRTKGEDDSRVFEYLFGQYIWYLTEGAPLRFYDALQIFAGSPSYKWQALVKSFWFLFKKKLPFVSKQKVKQ